MQRTNDKAQGTKKLWEFYKTATNFAVFSFTTDLDTHYALLNCTYVCILNFGLRDGKEQTLYRDWPRASISEYDEATSRVLTYASSDRLSEWDMKTLKPRCIPLVSGCICAGHLVSVCDSSRSKSKQTSRERFSLARVVDDGERDLKSRSGNAVERK